MTMNPKERLLGAVADLQRFVIHHPDQARCPVCPRWDELQQAALALVRAHDRDGERLDWLEHHLCYAMVSQPRQAMYSLPNDGRGWKNGQLRAVIDAAIAAEGE